MSNRRRPDRIQFGLASIGRAALPEVREERLRSPAVGAGASFRAMTAWRGLSGRRYVCTVHDCGALEHLDNALLLAVARDAEGVARIVHIVSGLSATAASEWAQSVAETFAVTEIHCHRLAETPAARVAIRADLGWSVEAEPVADALELA